MNTCKTCTYWLSHFDAKATYPDYEGECHRFPYKEYTREDHWCGEYFNGNTNRGISRASISDADDRRTVELTKHGAIIPTVHTKRKTGTSTRKKS